MRIQKSLRKSKITVSFLKKVSFCLGLLGIGTMTYAQTAGTWMVKGGYNRILPQINSGDLSAPSLPGTKMDTRGANAVIVTGAYMITDNISVELYLGAPYQHDLIGDGAIKHIGKFGTVKQLPPVLFAQYRFMPPTSVFRPYVGLGVTYTMFKDETSEPILTEITNPGGSTTTFVVNNAWGMTGQIGFTYALNEHWYVDTSATKTFIKTSTTLSTGQKIDADLNPIGGSVSIGYRF